MQQYQQQERQDANLPEWAEPQTHAAPAPPDPPSQKLPCEVKGNCEAACEKTPKPPHCEATGVPIEGTYTDGLMLVAALFIGSIFIKYGNTDWM